MKTMVAVPCLDMIHTRFVMSLLSLQIEGQAEFAFGVSSLVYDSRNRLCAKAIDEGFDRILWLDSDGVFAPDTFRKLSKHLDDGLEYVSGLCVKRKKPIEVTVYESVSLTEENGELVPRVVPYKDYPKDGLFQIAASGMACVMMSVNLVKKVIEEGGRPFSPLLGFGEDLSFCQRTAMAGYSMWCDSSVKIGHIGQYEYTEKDLEG